MVVHAAASSTTTSSSSAALVEVRPIAVVRSPRVRIREDGIGRSDLLKLCVGAIRVIWWPELRMSARRVDTSEAEEKARLRTWVLIGVVLHRLRDVQKLASRQLHSAETIFRSRRLGGP